MKRYLLSLFAAVTVLLTSCLENTQEITINENGGGTLTTKSDMSALIGLLKQFAGDKLDEMPKEKKDTTISFADGVNEMADLTDEEKVVLKNGSMHIIMDMAEDKMAFDINVPFTNTNQIPVINSATSKAFTNAIMSKSGGLTGGADMGEMGGIKGGGMDDYYTTTYTNNSIERKLNKEKYAGIDNDEMLSGMKQATTMGMNIKTTYVFNLPRPATKAEGKGITVSEDKKKITVELSLDELFDEPEKSAFLIEY